jgi:tannase/feruloyl esterase
MWLPTDNWNGKFMGVGNGGFAGSIQGLTNEMPQALRLGYATAGTDTGHQATGTDASWALDNPQRELDFGYRAVHLTADASKAIVAKYYGKDAERSYFVGCSRGGGQGMMESQRFPDDFDGIVSGAPAYQWPGIGAGFIQNEQKVYPDPAKLDSPVITNANRALLQKEILAACDRLDGVEDRVLNDPRQCKFDPATLKRCANDQPADDCVTGAQLAAIQEIYQGPQVNGKQVHPGFPFGGENDFGGWDMWITGRANALGPGNPNLHYAFGTNMYKYLVYDDANWDYSKYDFKNWEKDTRHAAEILNATDTDLGKFKQSSGKLLLWNGWSDPAITALGTIQYYDGVLSKDPRAPDYARLFLMPGVLHCAGGPGPDRVDWLAAISDWVEKGKAPDRLLASKADGNGKTIVTRPLCPYPQSAVYDGKGDPSKAESFACGGR